MPKVGIMADISVEVFENVVSPAKAEKRFNKLVSNLLETYYSNDTVRAYVDGKEEESHIEGLSSLQEQLSQATNSLNTMGMYGDSLQMSLDSAKEEFSEGIESPSGVSSSAELEDFKKEILESQRSFMEEMKSMMSSFVGGVSSVGAKTMVEEVKPVVEKPKSVVEEPKPVVEDSSSFAPLVSLPTESDSLEDVSSLFEVVEDDTGSELEEVSGEDILKNLVGSSNSLSFGG